MASSCTARPDTQAVVNELPKAIVRVGESPGGRLLVCATNSIGDVRRALVAITPTISNDDRRTFDDESERYTRS